MTATLILVAVIVMLLLAEMCLPRAGVRPAKGMRWVSNAFLGLAAYGFGRFVFGAGLVGLSLWADEAGIGVLHMWAIPSWLSLALSIVMLDFTLWAQHAVFHKVPWLWPVHRVHHSDDALDVTTAWRFHPAEIVISLGVKSLVIVGFGVPVAAIIVFEVVLAASAMFNHAHMRLPQWLDRALSILIVTPDMHRVHHGIEERLDRTNYGFFLNVWDRLSKTYRRMPQTDTDALQVGSDGAQASRTIPALLLQPFGKTRPRG